MTDPQRRQRLRILPTYVMETLSTRLNVAATPEALLDALTKAPVDAHLLNRIVWGIGSDVEAFFKHGDSWLVYEKDGRFDIVIIAYTTIGHAVHLLFVPDCRWHLRTVRLRLLIHQI